MPIPKIIHQIWIGPNPRPAKLMATFRDKHPDFEYILWTEEEIAKRGFHLENQAAYDSMEQWCGKADILRWEILYHYGGIYQDADSICLEPFDDILLSTPAFAGYESEVAREGLVAVGTMGFPAGHPLCRAAMNYIKKNSIYFAHPDLLVWATTGPGLLTDLLMTGKYPDFTVFPSYYFIPQHFTGVKYVGHAKVYCHQIWGTTVTGYNTIDDTIVPSDLLEPNKWVSLLICSYNANLEYIRKTLESIQNQQGHFGIELVWVDDCSDLSHSKELENSLYQFQKMTRFTRVVYHRNDSSLGLNACMKLGFGLCTCETIITPKESMATDYIYRHLNGERVEPVVPKIGSAVSLRSLNTVFDATMHALNHPFD